MIEKLIENKYVFYISTAVSALPFIYILSNSEDPRLSDGRLTENEAVWWEHIMIIACVAAIIISWASAISHAKKLYRTKWAVLIFILRPLAFVYGFMVSHKKID